MPRDAIEIEATSDEEERGQVTSMSIRAVATTARRRRGWLTVSLLFAFCALLAAAAFTVRMQPASGRLLITVAAPKSAGPIAVYVDGRLSCHSAPCTVEGLNAGTHLVYAMRPGSKPTAQLAATVSAGSQSSLHVELPDSEASPPRSAAAAPIKQADGEPQLASAAVAADAVTAARPQAPRAKAAHVGIPNAAPTSGSGALQQPAAAVSNAASAPGTANAAGAATPPGAATAPSAPSDRAILRISSEPSVAVTVDGQPVGKTPRLVRVPPGTHRVAFFGSEGRTSRTVTVAAGVTEDVSAAF